MLVPPALRPGDVVHVVAPSSPFDRTLVLRGMGFLATRYRVRWDPSMFERTGFLAGDDARRLGELSSALRAPDVRAVVAARGGYGLTRIVHRIEFEPLLADPKWIVGFSDITALHVEAMRVGVASIHGENVAGLGRGNAPGRAAWVGALESPRAARRLAGTDMWREGTAEGTLFGGNLTLLFTCAAAGRLRLPEPCILAIEDVSETSYRIDRMLSALVASGALASVRAIALGDFEDCSAGRHGVTARAVLEDCLGALGVPILAGLPFGHGRHNAPLAFGQGARVDGTKRELVQCLP
jgi:muramoyltetrapeptide carboxypeptidase